MSRAVHRAAVALRGPARGLTRRTRAGVVAATSLAVAAGGLTAVAGSAWAAPGDEVVDWVEVEDGAIAGGPALNSGDHGNFSGSGSYTFRERDMRSTMTVTVPEAGTYPVWIRYAAGPLSPEENTTRTMGLVANGVRQQVQFPMTSFADWEDWDFVRAPQDVALEAGENTIEVTCGRDTAAGDTCRLNLDAIQVGGTAPDRCEDEATVPAEGWTALFDGTFASFDGWRKAGGGGFGHQTDCTIRGFRGPGATWSTTARSGSYTLELDWRRQDADDASSVYLAAPSRGGDRSGGYAVRIGGDTAAIVARNGTTHPADATAVAAATQAGWNRFTIHVSGSGVLVLLNGTTVNSLASAASPDGFIGLENRGGNAQIDFRDIVVRPGDEVGRLAAAARRGPGTGGAATDLGVESVLGNLVAESQRRATSARIALVSPTALRTDLAAAGPYPAAVSYAEAAQAVLDDELVTVRLTGAQLRTALEQQWQRTADGEPTSRRFVRLGASQGLTWTYDPYAAHGSHITSMTLDGEPVRMGASYPVTLTRALAEGGDDFHELAEGTAPRTHGLTAPVALAAHLLGSAAAVAPDATQRSVGVVHPGGAKSSYLAGSAYAVDLSSWSFSGVDDPRDEEVQVTYAGRDLGRFAVESDADTDPFDEQGRVSVRTVLPGDLPTSSGVVRVVGTRTGTVVELPVHVVAAPTPTSPTPTPTPSPDPTPPVPTPTPVVEKSTPRLKVAVRPRRVRARATRARVVVRVLTDDHTARGKVRLVVGSRTYRGRLAGDKVRIRLRPFARAGRVKLTVRYLGDRRTKAARTATRVRVRPAR